MFGLPRHGGDHGRVAVVGLGRFGTALARTLTERGIEVLAMDVDPKQVQAVADVLTHAVVADSTDDEALRQAGVADYTHAVVAIGSDIEASILTTTLLAEFGIPDIWAKAVTATHGRILDRVGATHVVFPEAEMGRRVGNMVTASLLDYSQVDDELALAKTHPPGRLLGTPIDTVALEDREGVRLVALKRDSGGYAAPAEGTVLAPGDVLVVCGPPDRVRDFSTPR